MTQARLELPSMEELLGDAPDIDKYNAHVDEKIHELLKDHDEVLVVYPNMDATDLLQLDEDGDLVVVTDEESNEYDEVEDA